jgi:hypothetical protein
LSIFPRRFSLSVNLWKLLLAERKPVLHHFIQNSFWLEPQLPFDRNCQISRVRAAKHFALALLDQIHMFNGSAFRNQLVRNVEFNPGDFLQKRFFDRCHHRLVGRQRFNQKLFHFIFLLIKLQLFQIKIEPSYLYQNDPAFVFSCDILSRLDKFAWLNLHSVVIPLAESVCD